MAVVRREGHAEALRVMNQSPQHKANKCSYLCVVPGRDPGKEGKLEGYLWKDEVKKQVYVRSKPQPGAKTAVTLYRVLTESSGFSLVECDLNSSRAARQNSTPFAAAGHPLMATAGRPAAASGRTGRPPRTAPVLL